MMMMMIAINMVISSISAGSTLVPNFPALTLTFLSYNIFSCTHCAHTHKIESHRHRHRHIDIQTHRHFVCVVEKLLKVYINYSILNIIHII